MSNNWLKEQVAEAKVKFDGWQKWKQDAYKAEVERSKQAPDVQAGRRETPQPPVKK
jgi:hypothetical protein